MNGPNERVSPTESMLRGPRARFGERTRSTRGPRSIDSIAFRGAASLVGLPGSAGYCDRRRSWNQSFVSRYEDPCTLCGPVASTAEAVTRSSDVVHGRLL